MTLELQQATRLEAQAQIIDTGAVPVAAFSGEHAVHSLWGDGAMRVFRPDQPVARTASSILTGGDDGAVVLTTQDGVQQVAQFPRKWVDNVAAADSGNWACSVGKQVYLHEPDGRQDVLDHPSTVGGLAFDRKGQRLAVAHYGGVTIWSREKRRWKASSLKWAGSHVAVTWSPDDRFVVTSMQENALHGWRMRDKAELRMSGYPAKVKGWSWLGNRPWLATTGADSAILWSFEGAHGPMGKAPLQVCHHERILVTAVFGLPGQDTAIAGFADGRIMVSDADENAHPRTIKQLPGPAIEAIGMANARGWLFAADAEGRAHWMALA
jgi:WD40 repeat protein